MILGYHLFVCLLLVIIQTTVVAGLGPDHMYDLLGPFVVYLGIHHRPREAIIVLVFGGVAMDGISGGVFGVHLTAYLWLYAGVRWVIQFLHVDNVVLLPLLITAGVAFESLVVAFSAVVLASAAWPVEFMFSFVSRQVLWGAVTGPFLMLFFVRGQKAVLRFRTTYVADKTTVRRP